MDSKTHAFLILLSLPDVYAQFALQLSCLLAAILSCCRDGDLLSLLNLKSRDNFCSVSCHFIALSLSQQKCN